MSIATRIQSMYENVGDVYDTITNVTLPAHKNIENIPRTIRDSYLEIMNNGIEVIWDNWEKVTSTGSTLTLNQTEQAPMKIVYKGNTSQTGTPTPDTPIPIHVVSGDNSIVVCGKNFMPFTNQDFTLNNVRYYAQKGSLYLNGTSTGETSSKNQMFKDNFTFTLPAGTYYAINGNNGRSYYLYNKTTDVAIFSNPAYVGGGEKRSFTLAEKTTLYIGFYVYQNTFNNINTEIMISKIDTTYEPYTGESYPISLGDKELCKIGTYQDKIFKNTPNTTDYNSELEDNVWYLKKEIGKVVLNGTSSENWAKFSGFSFKLSNFENGYDTSTTTIHNILCNYLVSQKQDDIVNSRAVGISILGGTIKAIYVYISNEIDTLAKLQTWLGNNNLVVYYLLATPTYIEITDTTLLSQLEAIKTSYEGQTNISQVNDDLPFILDTIALSQLS